MYYVVPTYAASTGDAYSSIYLVQLDSAADVKLVATISDCCITTAVQARHDKDVLYTGCLAGNVYTVNVQTGDYSVLASLTDPQGIALSLDGRTVYIVQSLVPGEYIELTVAA
jgi:sugar lactone lactonase YvrE